jgi:hypothetical protein
LLGAALARSLGEQAGDHLREALLALRILAGSRGKAERQRDHRLLVTLHYQQSEAVP